MVIKNTKKGTLYRLVALSYSASNDSAIWDEVLRCEGFAEKFCHFIRRTCAPPWYETSGMNENIDVYIVRADIVPEMARYIAHGCRLDAVLQCGDCVSALPRAFSVLSADEQEKARRFYRLEDGVLYVVAHAALREVLSVAGGRRAPRQWRFARSAYGRPYLAADAFCDFNISHSWPWAVIVLCRNGRCGVDVEHPQHVGNWQSLLSDVCHENEIDSLNQRDASAEEFLHVWTAKEAVSKAIGRGLSIGFTSMEMNLRTGSLHIRGLPAQARFIHLADCLEEGTLCVAWAGPTATPLCCRIRQFDAGTGRVRHVGEQYVQ